MAEDSSTGRSTVLGKEREEAREGGQGAVDEKPDSQAVCVAEGLLDEAEGGELECSKG